MARHRDSPLVVGAPPQVKQSGRPVPYAMRTPMQHKTSVKDEEGRWKPKQPALFTPTSVEECPAAVFGQLPRGFLTGLALPYLKAARQDVLHVCSGALREKWTVDLRKVVHPRIVADGQALPFRGGAFPAVLLDPPYVPAWARQYGVKYPPTYPLLREAARVTMPGGRIGILHFLVPFPPKGTKRVALVGVSVAPGYQMRAFTVYEVLSRGPERLITGVPSPPATAHPAGEGQKP